MEIVILIVVGVVVLVVIILVIDGIGRFIGVRQPCGLKPFFLRRDACLGTCPPGVTCVATATRRYFFFGTQASACACLAPGLGGGPTTVPPGGVPGGEDEEDG